MPLIPSITTSIDVYPYQNLPTWKRLSQRALNQPDKPADKRQTEQAGEEKFYEFRHTLLSGFHSLFSTAGRIAHRLRKEDALMLAQLQGGAQRLAIDQAAHHH